jgi:hypothetical protein
MARPWHARALSSARMSALAALTSLLVVWAPASTEGVSTKVRALDVCHVHTWSTCIHSLVTCVVREATSPLGGAPLTLAWLLILRSIGCCANAGLVQPKASAGRRSEESRGWADLATTKSGTWLLTSCVSTFFTVSNDHLSWHQHATTSCSGTHIARTAALFGLHLSKRTLMRTSHPVCID